MIKLIVGTKGTGKTKILIDMVNTSLATLPGNIVCIEKGAKLTFDLTHAVRLVDVENYTINTYQKLYGFICGMLAGNYDIQEIYVDSILKIGGKDFDELGEFFDKIYAQTRNSDVKLVFTVSADVADLPSSVKKYL